MVRADERRERLVRSTLRAGWAKFGAADLDEATQDYISGVACSVMAEARGADEGERELLEHLGPLLGQQDLKDKQVTSLCRAIARCVFPQKTARKEGGDSQLGLRGDTVLCRCEDLILMYLGSSKLLLKDTTFELLRGHRYGVVGSNGAGKTTLMERIAEGAVEGLARSGLRFVHIRHETLGERCPDPRAPAAECARGLTGDAPGLEAALDEVGFSAELRRKALRELSGGWRVRLLLATAVAQRADVMLLDEPTNHLDAEAVQWLVSYLTRERREATCLIVSHDAQFLNKVCTDIIHFDDCRLKYYAGNFARFQEQAMLHEEEEIRALLQVRSKDEELPARSVAAAKADDEAFRMSFPIPGKVEGVASSKKVVMELRDASYKYPLGQDFVLKHVSCKVTMSSRVAIVGPNGAGKSTLMALLCGESRPSPDERGHVGDVDRHRSLRLAYIAQDHMFHFAEYASCTPVEYMQLRFRNGYDEELQRRLNSPVDAAEEAQLNALAVRFGKYSKRVEAVLARSRRGKEWRYEVKWQDLGDRQNTFEPISRLRQLGVERMATALDERLASVQAGTDERPLTRREIVKHFENFGLSEEMVAQRSISAFSGGQKSKLMIGAAFWTKPHLVCLDEPTNFLDFETVGALGRALRTFRGGVVIVSHDEEFLAGICNEIWSVKDREVVVVKTQPALPSSDDVDGADEP